MHWISHVILLAQVSPEDITREISRLDRNFSFLWFALAAAWIVLTIYVLMMVGREGRLKREIANLKAMLEERQKK